MIVLVTLISRTLLETSPRTFTGYPWFGLLQFRLYIVLMNLNKLLQWFVVRKKMKIGEHGRAEWKERKKKRKEKKKETQREWMKRRKRHQRKTRDNREGAIKWVLKDNEQKKRRSDPESWDNDETSFTCHEWEQKPQKSGYNEETHRVFGSISQSQHE